MIDFMCTESVPHTSDVKSALATVGLVKNKKKGSDIFDNFKSLDLIEIERVIVIIWFFNVLPTRPLQVSHYALTLAVAGLDVF